MKIVVYTLAMAALLAGGCYSLRESSSRVGYDFTGVDKVAIVAVEGALRSEAAKDEIASFFAMELLEQGYAPVGRAQVRALLKDEESGSEDLTTIEGAVEAGLILDVPAVLAIEIHHFAEEISMTSTMISVDDGSILWQAKGTGKSGRSISNMLGFGEEPGIGIGGEDEELLGGAPGGQLGGPAGRPLSPEDAEKAQGIVKRMCRSLPAKAAPEW
jgi:hypothetical protein